MPLNRPDQPVAPQYNAPARYILVYNQEASLDIPAHGLMEITGRNDDGAFTVRRPTRDGLTGLLAVSSHSPIPAESLGQALFECWPCSVAIGLDEDGDAAEAGSMAGVSLDSFVMSTSRPGFRVLEDAVNGVAVVAPMERTLVEVVKITSTTQEANGWYPGLLYYYDPVTEVTVNTGIAIWVVDLNL